MKARPLPSAEFLRHLFEYNKETGVLCWKNSRSQKAPPGAVAGWRHKGHACIYVQIEDRKMKAHRVIWKIVTGDEPPSEIDHRNGDGFDNRWSNLRSATHKQNSRNTKLRCDNSSGFKGVSFHKQAKKWRARIFVDGSERPLGLFHRKEDAIAAYGIAATNAFGEFARIVSR